MTKKTEPKKIGFNREETRQYVVSLDTVRGILEEVQRQSLYASYKGFSFVKSVRPVQRTETSIGISGCQSEFEPTGYDQSVWCYEVVIVRRW